MAIEKEGMFTYHILQDRERKNLTILELIRKKGPISRAEISRTMGLNIVTVSNYIDFYINKRIILEVGLDVSSGGRRPELLELNAKNEYVIGVDLGPTSIITIVADLKVRPVVRLVRPRPQGRMEDLIPEVAAAIEEVIVKSALEREKIRCIGIGVSGIVDYTSGTIRDTDPMRGRTKVSFLKFTKALEQQFNIPAFVGNDASCAAFGEKTLNPGADVDNLIYLYSDVGCGLVVQGDVYVGANGCAGETQLAFNGTTLTESTAKEYTYLKPFGVDLGVVAEAKRLIEKGMPTEIVSMVKGDKSLITKSVIVEAANKNDKLALEVIARAGMQLGTKVAYMINFLNPSVVIVGGGVERAGDAFLDGLKSAVKKYGFEEPASSVRIMPSLLGEDGIVLGAAALASRELFIRT